MRGLRPPKAARDVLGGLRPPRSLAAFGSFSLPSARRAAAFGGLQRLCGLRPPSSAFDSLRLPKAVSGRLRQFYLRRCVHAGGALPEAAACAAEVALATAARARRPSRVGPQRQLHRAPAGCVRTGSACAAHSTTLVLLPWPGSRPGSSAAAALVWILMLSDGSVSNESVSNASGSNGSVSSQECICLNGF